jgi:hypothetical protein
LVYLLVVEGDNKEDRWWLAKGGAHGSGCRNCYNVCVQSPPSSMGATVSPQGTHLLGGTSSPVYICAVFSRIKNKCHFVSLNSLYHLDSNTLSALLTRSEKRENRKKEQLSVHQDLPRIVDSTCVYGRRSSRHRPRRPPCCWLQKLCYARLHCSRKCCQRSVGTRSLNASSSSVTRRQELKK